MKCKIFSLLFFMSTMTAPFASAMVCKGQTEQGLAFELTTMTESNRESIPGLLDQKYSRFIITSPTTRDPYRLLIKNHSWLPKTDVGIVSGPHFEIQYKYDFGCFREVNITAKLSPQITIDTTVAVCEGGLRSDEDCAKSSQ